ncbi:hypothetical protein PHMEG_00010758 [Phytophthora megakarya]|uniref:Uncharacterized protein n=1 Tax=Phytophthora megakarya TaxID=4795 RepID=A0A225WEM6_9STRA|nr:hypothetical protein PHMEG_00010758 [Phytophthora megakarya]
MEKITTSRMGMCGVDDACDSSSEPDEGDTFQIVEAIVRDRRNAYPDALKAEVLDDIDTGLTATVAAILHGIKSRTAYMRREDFPLRTLHVLVFIKEEYEDFTTTYLAKNKDESLERMIRRIVHRRAVYYDDTPTRLINECGAKKGVKIKGRPVRSQLQYC